ncbi:MAG: hypothetical protein M1837_006622 [Sclerophora amabilis]|nr:MAG: hypothetical protein M1837_006622 [Sclerophora amabilis]
MTPPKRIGLGVDALKALAFSDLDDASFRNKIRELLKESEEKRPTLSASELKISDSFKLFGLTNAADASEIFTLALHDIYQPPDLLRQIQQQVEFVVSGATENEAYARCLLNNVLVCCVAEEKRFAQRQRPLSTNLATTSEISSRPSTPEPSPAELILQFETELSYPVTYKGKQRTINGRADFSLWYDKNATLGTNLVVVEAKRRHQSDSGLGQLVAYMGIIHEIRKDEKRDNAVVYGISTDGVDFRFHRIDNNGTYSKSTLLEWDYSESHVNQITSYLRYIVRAAISSSPSTTPIKPGTKRDVSLEIFKDVKKAAKFDFDIGLVEIDEDMGDYVNM